VGHPEGWVGFASLLAEQAQARIVLPDYRLAPEHPFPAALNDATAVLTSVTEEHGPPIVAGDSAGGGLAAALVLVARATQLPAPLGTILISPWLDLTQSAETFGSNADCDLFFPLAVAIEAAEQYLQGHSASDPFASPLFADVADFPPSLILAGGDEALLADATRFVGRLALAGRHVEAMFVAEMQHTWPNLFPDLPESMDAIAAMAGFAIRATRR
jgi:acetyl esterase/lipase